MIKIETIDNGWLVTCNDDPDAIRREAFVYSESGDPKEIDGLSSMLWFLSDYFIQGSKYDLKRIRIVKMPGYKYEGYIDDEAYRKELQDLKDELESCLAVTGE